jgi:hypothetical protein
MQRTRAKRGLRTKTHMTHKVTAGLWHMRFLGFFTVWGYDLAFIWHLKPKLKRKKGKEEWRL